MSNQQITELVAKIQQSRTEYYNGSSTVSDQLYDSWMSELGRLDPFNAELVKVGAEPVSNWEKHTHTIPMGSLNKCNTFAELQKWAETYDIKVFFVTNKLDGLSLSLIYEDGKLVKAITRGNGSKGEDITQNVQKIPNIPFHIPLKGTVHVRGEIMFELEAFKDFEKEYSNPRNAASGISRRYDGTNCEQLRFYAYQIFSDELKPTTEVEQFESLKTMSFTVPDYQVFNTINQVEDFRNKFDRKVLPYEVDGLVIRQNDLIAQKHHGETNQRPKAAIAYKFDAEGSETVITSIDFQVGSTGIICPVAYFKEVEVDGAKLKKCSLYNFDYIKELCLNVGAKVLVIRANQVIPRIQECIEPNGPAIEPPKFCPECQSPTHFVGSYLKCSKPETCVKTQIGKITKFIETMNIMEWGDKLIAQLFEKKLVTKISDLYNLTVDQLASLDRMAEKSAQNCVFELNDKKEISLDRFLGAIGIPGVSESTIRLLMDAGFDSFDKIIAMTVSQLQLVKGVGGVKAQSIHEFFAEHLGEVKEIYKHLVIGVKSAKLAGKSFCFTGSFSTKREKLEDLVKQNGGTVKSSVTKDLGYLVTNDTTSGSSKNKKATDLGVLILSEDGFKILLSL